MKEQTKHLKFFGIDRILPFLAKFRKQIALMILFGLTGSATDIILPLFQRYALDHYVGLGVFVVIVAVAGGDHDTVDLAHGSVKAV